MESATSEPTKLSALKRRSVVKVWRAMTMPVNMAVSSTTGIELTPTFTIWRSSSRQS